MFQLFQLFALEQDSSLPITEDNKLTMLVIVPDDELTGQNRNRVPVYFKFVPRIYFRLRGSPNKAET
jgi:hypothetical protein